MELVNQKKILSVCQLPSHSKQGMRIHNRTYILCVKYSQNCTWAYETGSSFTEPLVLAWISISQPRPIQRVLHFSIFYRIRSWPITIREQITWRNAQTYPKYTATRSTSSLGQGAWDSPRNLDIEEETGVSQGLLTSEGNPGEVGGSEAGGGGGDSNGHS